jgi:hypothetical protein
VDTRLGASVTRQMRLHQKIEFVETYYLVETRRRGYPSGRKRHSADAPPPEKTLIPTILSFK